MMEENTNLTPDGVETTTIELVRLIRWLLAHGFTHEQAYECIAYMAGSTEESSDTTHPHK